MASSAQVADGIRDLTVDWGSAEELDEVLRNLHQIGEAIHDKFQVLADKLQETALKEAYGQKIAEIAGDYAGSADKIREAVGGGVLQG